LEKIDFTSVTAEGYGFQIEMTYRARSRGASIIEVPISFKDRARGESKMSRSIVVEALALVTKWAAERWYHKGKSGYQRVKSRRR
jgi:dolichol-phosphate mannosyltransferase